MKTRQFIIDRILKESIQYGDRRQTPPNRTKIKTKGFKGKYCNIILN